MAENHCFEWGVAANEVKDFWMEKNQELARELQHGQGPQITAVSKIVCIQDVGYVGQGGLLSKLISANASADVFKSETIKVLVNWAWIAFFHVYFRMVVVLQFCGTIGFSVFAQRFGLESADPQHHHIAPEIGIASALAVRIYIVIFQIEPLSGQV